MKKTIILVSLMLLLLVGTGVCLQEPSPAPPVLSQYKQNKAEPKQTESNTIQQIPNEVPAVIRIIPTQPPNPEKENNAKKSNDTAADNWPLFNILLVAFNGLLAIFTFLLWRSTQQTDKTSRLRDRAYLYLTPSVLPYPPGKVTHWGIGIVIENAGIMPAKNVKLKYAFAASEKTKWSQAEWQILDSSITIGPKRQFPLQGKDIPIDTINKIAEGKAEVFIMAEAIYVDEFFPGEDRVTQMNVRLNVDSDGGHSFGYPPEHNCTDDDCKK